MSTGKLLLVRHGQTAHNAEKRFQGHADTSLDSVGVQQVTALARHLQAQHLTDPHIHSSDLARAYQSAQILRQHLGGVLHAAPALREIHMGDWENKAYADLAQSDPQGTSRFWGGDFYYQMPGGESPELVSQRALAYVQRHWPRPGQTAIFVSHGVTISTLLCALLGLDYAAEWAAKTKFHDNAGYSVMQVGPTPGQVLGSEVALRVETTENII